MPFTNQTDSSRDLIIFISFNFSLENINVVRFAKSEVCIPDPNIFWWIAVAVNPNGETLLTNGLNTFSTKGNPVFSNGCKSLPKNPHDSPILCNWVFDNFILAEELFAKDLWSLKTCALVNNYLCRKLFSPLESPTTFQEIFKVISVPFFISSFNLLSYELDNFMFKVFH